MTRRHFLLVPLVAPLALAQTQQPVLYAAKEEQEFAAAFNVWATMGNQNGAIVDAKEIRAWHATRAAWHKLDKTVSQSYK